MNTLLWIVQILLALAFAAAGAGKLFSTRDRLYAQGMKYVEDLSANTLKGIGSVEILGAAGLILPALTGLLPVLTPLAAVGLMLVQSGAALTHTRRKENGIIAVNAVLFIMAAFIAYGRFVAVPL